MKKVFFFSITLILVSCSKEQTSPLEQENSLENQQQELSVQETDILYYSFKGQDYEVNPETQIALSSDAELELKEILSLPNLVTFYDGGKTVKLFESVKSYQKFESKLVKDGLISTEKSVNGLAVVYEDSYYKGNKLYIYEAFNSSDERIGLVSHPSGGTWNDRASSIKVQNGIAWFYNDASWDSSVSLSSRRYLVLADLTENNGYAVGYRRLKSVRYPGCCGNWNDRISEAEWK